MPSQDSQAMGDLFVFLNRYLNMPSTDVGLYRLLLEELHSVTPEPTDVTYEEVLCPGTVRPAIWCKPHGASPSRVILYLHGGAFAAGSPSSHRKVVAHIAKAVGCYALIIDYRRAPEHQFPAAIEDAVAAFRWLRDVKGIPSTNIATAGDSAGGNLSVTTALKLRESGEQTQAAIVCFSPWFDMKMTGESYKTNAETDILVNRTAIEQMSGTYVGSASLDDPLIDLLNADFTGMPPMYLASGGSEIVASDVEQLGARARESGVEVHTELSEGMQHLYFFMVGRTSEADQTIEHVRHFLRQKLAL
ncbi:Alpha/Beta hydrolase protein [Aspergillus unguis]